LISSTPFGTGGGVDATATNRSSTIYLKRSFDARYRRTARAKPWVVRQLERRLEMLTQDIWRFPRGNHVSTQ
jgi:hypothetical protein